MSRIALLEYRLGRNVYQRQFETTRPRYPTREAARKAALEVNRERTRQQLPPLTHILMLPAGGPDDVQGDASHFLSVELL